MKESTGNWSDGKRDMNGWKNKKIQRSNNCKMKRARSLSISNNTKANITREFYWVRKDKLMRLSGRYNNIRGHMRELY